MKSIKSDIICCSNFSSRGISHGFFCCMARRQLDLKSYALFNIVDEKRETTFKISHRVTRFQGHFRSDASVVQNYDYYKIFASAVLFGVTNDTSEQQWAMYIQLTFGAILDTEHA